MVNILRVDADHTRDSHPFADHMTKLKTITEGEIQRFNFHFN